MKNYYLYIIFLSQLFLQLIFAAKNIPANDPNIQYYGRWDFSIPTAPTHSWPGVYIYAKFEGTSIGVSMNDNFCYYNLFIDDTVFSIFHGNKSGVASYTLASGLADGQHTILFTLRNETNWTKFSFNGFILDDGKNLLTPPERPEKKIEFIGDSYTCASGNLWTDNNAAPSGDYTDVYQGFASITARHYAAQYMVSGRGGIGLVLDYLGNYSINMQSFFDRSLVYTPTPKWNFSSWIPNLVVIGLGLNDYNGWGGYSGPISQDYADLYRQRYHDFISTVMDVYPYVKILVVAPNDITWLKEQFSQVVAEENALGHTNVFYTYYPSYGGHYVNSGHPDVYAHNEIANKLITAIDAIDAWTPFNDTIRPRFTSLPDTPTVATTSSCVLKVTTSKFATVRYSTQDKSFDQMEHTFATTGTRIHSVTLPCDQNNSYTYYLRAKDIYGNETVASAVVQFSVDTTKELVPWYSDLYDHSSWQHGLSPLGNDGTGLYNTTIDTTQTAYFVQSIPMQNVAGLTQLKINVVGHDGAVAYLNGHEVGRVNIESISDVTYSTTAIHPMKYNTTLTLTGRTTLNYLHDGENIFAFEVHPWSNFKKGIVFEVQIMDQSDNIIYEPGSDWYYYDQGKLPPNQLVDKPITNVAANELTFLPEKMCLFQNYPNPFNPSTNITFDITKKSHVELNIYNMLGQYVETLVNTDLVSGRHTYRYNIHNMSSGVYFYRLIVWDVTGKLTFSNSKSMVVIK